MVVKEERMNLNDIFYPEDLNYIVTNDVGGLRKGESIKGLSIGEILEKICCYAPIKTDIEYLNLVEAPKLWNAGITGKGVKIGLVGTGIATNNSIANVKKSFDAITKKEVIIESNSDDHDVGVLSNLASKKYGIAYDSDIYVGDLGITNAVDASQELFTERFKLIMDWFIEQEVDMISASVTFDKINKKVFKEYMNKLIDKNILFIVAIGNNRGYGDPRTNISYHNVINIGAVDKNKVATDFQTNGEHMTFTCFGKDVKGYNVNLSETSNDGTSFATPYAAGLIACLIQQGKERGLKLTFRQIRDIMARNCESLGDIGKNDKYGYGLIKGTFLPENIKTDFDLRIEENKIIGKINYNLPDILYSNKEYNLNLCIYPSLINYRKVNITTSTVDVISIKEVNNEFILTTLKDGKAKIVIKLETGEEENIEIDVIKTEEASIEDCKKLYSIDILHNAGFKGKGIKIAYCCSGAEKSQYTTNIKGGEKFSTAYDDIYIEGSRYKDATACISVLSYLVPEAEVYILKVKNEWGGLTNATIENSLYEYVLNNNFDIVVWDYIVQGYDSDVKTNYLNKINNANIIQIRNSFSNLNAPQTMNRDDYIGAQVIGATILNHKNSIVSEFLNDVPHFDAVYNEFNLGTDRSVQKMPWVLVAVVALYKNQNKDLNTEKVKEILIDNAKKIDGQTTFTSVYKNGLMQARII